MSPASENCFAFLHRLDQIQRCPLFSRFLRTLNFTFTDELDTELRKAADAFYAWNLNPAIVAMGLCSYSNTRVGSRCLTAASN